MSSVGQKEVTTMQRILMLFYDNIEYICFGEKGSTKWFSRVTTEETKKKAGEKGIAVIANNSTITIGKRKSRTTWRYAGRGNHGRPVRGKI